MSNDLKEYEEKTLEDIKHKDKRGNEFWYARELQKIFEYTDWKKFESVIKKAIRTCKLSKLNEYDHFKMISTKRKQKDYKLSRYACYIIVQNADPKYKKVAEAQTYIATQTRKRELIEQYENAGYMGLYNGQTKEDISKRKGLKNNENIMNKNELAANIFRISLTEELLKKQENIDETEITKIHYKVGKVIRETIEELGTTLPEDLPTPKKSRKTKKVR